MSASFIPVALLPELGAGLQRVGGFSEETIAAAALLDYEASTGKAVELQFFCRFAAGAATPNSRKLSPPRPVRAGCSLNRLESK